MNYAEARERQADHRWDWTNKRDNQVWAVGYCGGWHDWTDEQAARVGMPRDTLQADKETRDGPFRAKFHTDGHATKEEAERCFYEHSLDRVHEIENSSIQHRCSVPLPLPGSFCDAWTTKGLESPGYGGCFQVTWLCDAHRNREGLVVAHPFQKGLSMIHS